MTVWPKRRVWRHLGLFFPCCPSNFIFMGLCWPLLATVGLCGPALAFIGRRWPLWAFVDLHWPLLAFVGHRWLLCNKNKRKNLYIKKITQLVWPKRRVWRR